MQKYDSVISIRGVNRVVIGGLATASIRINDKELGDDYLTLTFRGTRLFISEGKAKDGVYVNGTRCTGEQEIRDTDFFALADYGFYFKNGCLYTDSSFKIKLQGLRFALSVMGTGAAQYPKFVRNVRKKTVLSTEPITVLDPPQKPQAQKSNIFLQLLPAVGSIMLVVLLRGVMGGGGSFVIFSACTMALGAITTLITYFSGKRDYKRKTQDRESEYLNYIEKKREEIKNARFVETRQLQQLYPSPQDEMQMVHEFSGDLFNRQAGDEDYLQIRIGEGEKLSLRPIKITEKESITVAGDMFEIPRKLADEFRYIENAPVWLNAMDDNAIGVVGDETCLQAMLKVMSLDLALRQYHTDLKLAYLVGQDDKESLSWIKWLPHVRNDALGTRNIVCDEDSRSDFFEYLYIELSARAQQKYMWPHYVVFVLEEYGIVGHPISKYFDRAKELGFTFIFFANKEELLPQNCDEVVTLERASNKGVIYKTSDLNQRNQFVYSKIHDEDMRVAARTISPVYSEEVSLENGLTSNLSFFDMLGISSPKEIDLEQNWRLSGTERSLAAPLGVSTKGVVSLDLHQSKDGPHGLVAGTTGSGKSELLQSYVLSMAVKYHPYDVCFMIIDFKGGGMANQFKGLPHLLGTITNIDGREVERSLKSIKAELKRRQILFAEAGVSKLSDYARRYKNHELAMPLPHLIIIVDEFAELRAQQPEFMKELISAARIGRSLGVHLILATQKPSGQVDDQIWSNSRFKLCLKVATSQDSNEMIKSPLAAEIREPGRAYLMIGENERMELFQSAYSGGPAGVEMGDEKEFSIYEVDPSGMRSPVFVQKRKKGSSSRTTQLDAVVEHIAKYCEATGLEKLPDICLPSLPERIAYKTSERRGDMGIFADIGVYDDPDNQRQGIYFLDLESNNFIVIGSSQTGKTCILQAIIRSLSEKYSPQEVAFYIIDFASMALTNFEGLAHVGGVVCPSDDEKLKNLLKFLHAEIDMRKEKILSLGVSSFTAYKEAGKTDLPLIVVIIDNLTALKGMYFEDNDEELIGFCREGLSVGISIVIANPQTAGIGYKYLSNISSRAALYCNDSGEYNTLFDHCRERIENIPGRCLVEVDHNLLECQAYLAFEGEKEIERVHNIRNYIESLYERDKGFAASRIPSIPDILTSDTVFKQMSGYMSKPFLVVVGVDYENVAPMTIDMAAIGLLAVTGRERFGRHNWLRYVLEMVEHMYPGQSEVYLVDSVEKRLAGMRGMKNIYAYGFLEEDAVSFVEEIEQRLKGRYEKLLSGEEDALASSKLLLLVIDNLDAIRKICDDPEAFAAYENVIGRYKNMRAGIVVFADNVNIAYSAPDILKAVRDQKHLMYFDDISNLKICDMPLAVERKFKKTVSQGDGYYIRGSECTKLKTPLSQQSQ